jgi:alkylation response protein AidB-like acyl-CoA dehydrogenase
VADVEELTALRESVRGLLARHRAANGDDGLPLWRRLCAEIGVAGLAVPERFGGAGAGPAEVGVVQEELGRVLADTPMLGSAVLATEALLASGDEAACSRLLPGLADGSQIGALAWTTAAGNWDPAEVACRAGGAGGRALPRKARPPTGNGCSTARRTTYWTVRSPPCSSFPSIWRAATGCSRCRRTRRE